MVAGPGAPSLDPMSYPARPLVIAHRGASGYRPEHTRAAYELGFQLGADAVEPDIVATKDGVLVLRHENEISGTTDVASRPEFAQLRTTKTVDGHSHTGWFTEDFTWEQLSTLRARERLPEIRGTSYDGQFGILRLTDLLAIIDAESARLGRQLILVAEMKSAAYFESLALPLDELFATAVAGWASHENLIVESFEQTVLRQLTARGVPGRRVFLAETSGAPADLVARDGADARSYAEHLSAAGLARLAKEVDGVSVDKRLLLATDARGEVTGTTDLVDRAHVAGLEAYTWTLRAENRFLAPNFRRGTEPAEFGNWREEFRTLIDTGVDGIFADQPDLALEALA
jgi:glycerophosphoryl diester phosphodiesterase